MEVQAHSFRNQEQNEKTTFHVDTETHRSVPFHIIDNESEGGAHISETPSASNTTNLVRWWGYQTEVALESKYGFLPQDDPLQLKLQEILDKIIATTHLDLRVAVLDRSLALDGYILPTGLICVSKRFLRALTTEDQIAAFFAHESQHLKSGHIEKKIELLRRESMKEINLIGFGRLSETEADLASVISALEHSGYQPLAGASLLNQIAEFYSAYPVLHGRSNSDQNPDEGKSKMQGPIDLGEEAADPFWTPGHGGLADRVLNILMLAYIIDVQNLELDETPLEDSFKEHVRQALIKTRDDREREATQPSLPVRPKEVVESPTVRNWESLLKNKHLNLAISIVSVLDDLLEDEIPDVYERRAVEIVLAHFAFGISFSRLEAAALFPSAIDGFYENGVDIFERALSSDLLKRLGIDSFIEPTRIATCLEAVFDFLDSEVGMFLDDESGGNSLTKFADFAEAAAEKVSGSVRKLTGYDVSSALLLEHMYRVFIGDNQVTTSELSVLGERLPVYLKDCGESTKESVVDGSLFSLSDLRIFSKASNMAPEKQIPEERHVFDKIVGIFISSPHQFLDQVEVLMRDPLNLFDHGIIEDIVLDLAFPVYAVDLAKKKQPYHGKLSINSVEAHDVWMRLALISSRVSTDIEFYSAFPNCIDALFRSKKFGIKEKELLSLLDTITNDRFAGDKGWTAQFGLPELLIDKVVEWTAKKKDPEKCFEMLEKWNTYARIEFYGGSNYQSHASIIEKLTPSASTPIRRLIVSNLVSDPLLKRQARACAVSSLVHDAPFDDLLDLLFGRLGSLFEGSESILDEVVEKRANTPRDLRAVENRVMEHLNEKSFRAIAHDVTLDAVCEYSSHMLSDLAIGALGSRQDATKLHSALLGGWWRKVRVLDQVDEFNLLSFADPKYVRDWINDSPTYEVRRALAPTQELEESARYDSLTRNYRTLCELVERLYKSDYFERNILTRKLLIGPNAVLRSHEETRKLFDQLLSAHVDIESTHRAEVEKIADALFLTANAKEIYFLIASLVAQHVFQRPEQQLPIDFYGISLDEIRKVPTPSKMDALRDDLQTINDEIEDEGVHVASRAGRMDDDIEKKKLEAAALLHRYEVKEIELAASHWESFPELDREEGAEDDEVCEFEITDPENGDDLEEQENQEFDHGRPVNEFSDSEGDDRDPEEDDERIRLLLIQLAAGEIDIESYRATRLEQLSKEREEGKLPPDIESFDDALAQKVTTWAFTYNARNPEGDAGDSAFRKLERAEQRFIETIPLEFRVQNASTRMSESEALIEVATRMGAPGVRFLQLLGQYIHVPHKVEQDFSKVYDNLRGQSKLSAFRTINRELPDFLQDEDQFHERIGGGSLVTVYGLTQGEEKSVLKVLNPNAEKRTKESMALARRTVNHLIAQYPDNPHYALIRDHLLADLEEWLLGDINDVRFDLLDPDFREQWSGFSVDINPFSIYVPKSISLGTKFVKMEEFVEGVNLTQISVGDRDDFPAGVVSADSYKHIISLLTNNYIRQILSGVVHSDVHPGNFRVMPNGQVAILDRNFFIELEHDDTQFLFSLASGGSAASVIDYLLGKEDNASFRDKRNELVSALPELCTKDFLANPETILGFISKVKELGLRVPLPITLLIKNLNGLNRLAVHAGFAGIGEALAA